MRVISLSSWFGRFSAYYAKCQQQFVDKTFGKITCFPELAFSNFFLLILCNLWTKTAVFLAEKSGYAVWLFILILQSINKELLDDLKQVKFCQYQALFGKIWLIMTYDGEKVWYWKLQFYQTFLREIWWFLLISSMISTKTNWKTPDLENM